MGKYGAADKYQLGAINYNAWTKLNIHDKKNTHNYAAVGLTHSSAWLCAMHVFQI
jgi:hypothetical protein